MANPIPSNTPVDVLTKDRLSLSLPWSQWFNYLVGLLGFVVDYSQASPQVPLTGFSIVLDASTQVLQLNPAGTLATGAVTLPATPVNGQTIEILSTATVTAFTLNPSAGQTIKNAPTTLTAGIGVALYYNKGITTWFRRY